MVIFHSNLGRLAALLSALPAATLAKDWEGEPYTWLYQFPLPIPPQKQVKQTVINPVTNRPIDYYEINIHNFTQQVYPNKPATNLVGYDGISPGPTIMAEKDREIVVRFVNNASRPNSVHLHGSPSRTPWDGWAEDTTNPGQYKDYYYPNFQSGRLLWYHDHAIDITAVNAYFGQAGAYILHDPAEDALNLPSGYGQYDIPLILSSKQYQSNGQLVSPEGELTSLFGDVVHVNGQPWPYLKVEPRKYRFRILNAAVSRTFGLYFEKQGAEGKALQFQVIASDSGLLSGPANTTKLWHSMAERWEVVFDFSQYKNQNVTLRSDPKVGADTPYLNTDKVMRFVVGDTIKGGVDPSSVPAKLRDIPALPDKTDVAHHFKFERKNGGWRINGVSFDDVNNRVLAAPPRGSIEVWELENSSGGWTHPIHVHLVDFKVVKRIGGDNRGVQNYEAQGLKDVVWLAQGETVTIEANYAPWDGLYMFHCHNLVHEDHAMMAAFNVTALPDLGYNETSFADPMEARWRAKNVNPADFTPEAITQKIQSMALLQPYNNHAIVDQKLEAYWAARGGAKVRARRIR